jgi:hypothetical protein
LKYGTLGAFSLCSDSEDGLAKRFKSEDSGRRNTEMKTENLTKACGSFDRFFSELREAHTDAVNSENQFAEVALFSLIEEAAKMQAKMYRIRDAANYAAVAKKSKSVARGGKASESRRRGR